MAEREPSTGNTADPASCSRPVPAQGFRPGITRLPLPQDVPRSFDAFPQFASIDGKEGVIHRAKGRVFIRVGHEDCQAKLAADDHQPLHLLIGLRFDPAGADNIGE